MANAIREVGLNKDNTSLWWDKDCTGYREAQLRKWFYGSTANISDSDGEGISVITEQPQYEDTLSDPLYRPVSRFSVADMESLKFYTKDELGYLEKGLESFDIY
jgi:hypothetical protein